MPNKNHAFDANFKVKYSDSNRSYDENGFLRVKDCVLTAEEVSDYLGKEIGGWRELGLEPNELVGIYRPLDEIEKAVHTYNALPLTDNHIVITPSNPHRERIFGTSGSTAYMQDGQLINDVVVWVGKGIDEIEAATKDPSRGRKDLSCGYTYDLVQESGEFNGKPYQFKMVNIQANHVALVKEARVEGAGIADSKPVKKGMFMFSLAKFLKAFANDGKAKDGENLREVAKGLASMAKDADYEGKEDKLLDEMAEVLTQLKGNQNAEKAADNEPSEEEKKKAADEEAKKKEEKEAKDNETKEAEKKDAADSAVKQFGEVMALGTKVIGRINPDMLMDASSEALTDKILTLKKVAIDGKTPEQKLELLKSLAANVKSAPQARAQDSRTSKVSNNGTKLYNPANRKG